MQYFKKIARSLTSILLHFMYFQKCSVALTACFCMPQPYNCPKACMYMNKCGNLWKLGQLLHLAFKSLIVKQYIVLWIVQCCWNTHCHLWYWDISQDGFCSSPRLKTFCTVLCKRPVQRFHKLSHSVPLWPPKFVPMPLSVPENRLWAASEKKDKVRKCPKSEWSGENKRPEGYFFCSVPISPYTVRDHPLLLPLS